MSPFDHRRHRRIGDRPEGRNRLHRGERQVIPGNCVCPRAGVFRDLACEFPGVDWLPTMLGQEEFTGDLSPYPRPLASR
jgi:hypothetical protein